MYMPTEIIAGTWKMHTSNAGSRNMYFDLWIRNIVTDRIVSMRAVVFQDSTSKVSNV